MFTMGELNKSVNAMPLAKAHTNNLDEVNLMKTNQG